MASSFIDFKENGFWAYDGFVEAMQLCLIHEIETKGMDATAWLMLYKVELAIESCPMIYGGMSMRLDEFIIDEARKETLIGLIDAVVKKIALDKTYLSGHTLHLFRKRAMELLWAKGRMRFKDEKALMKLVNDSRWEEASIQEIKERYIHHFDLLKQLIMGNIKTTASSKIDY